jgi:hypothetical protein
MHTKKRESFNYLFFLFRLACFLAAYYSLPSWAQLNVHKTEQKRYPIENKLINESSGLACSTREKKVLWTHNDSGHMPIIYALNHKGKDLGAFHLDDVESYDWEDMDAFEYQDEHYLLIADTGDNLRFRWDYQITIIKEPSLHKMPHKKRSAISPAWSFVFKYENDKSYDVESVAVDSVRKKIILLSKHTSHAYLFELPLNPPDNGQMPTAIKVAELNDIVKPTALDISADGTLMSINTYGRIHRFRRDKPENSWRYEHSLKYKKLFQPEAMCLSKDEKHYFISSERKSYLLKVNAQ